MERDREEKVMCPLTEDVKDLAEDRKAEIDELDEAYLYFFIDECGLFIWRMNHDMAHGRIPEHGPVDKDIHNVRVVQHYAVTRLPEVVEGIIPQDEYGYPTKEYWAWYRWWDRWKKDLTDKEWNALELKLRRKEDISEYRPSGSWKSEEVNTE